MKRFALSLVLFASLAFAAAPALAHGHHGGLSFHHGSYGYGQHLPYYGYGMTPFNGAGIGMMPMNTLGVGGYPSAGYGFGYSRLQSPMLNYGFGQNTFGMGFGGANYGPWGGFGAGF